MSTDVATPAESGEHKTASGDTKSATNRTTAIVRKRLDEGYEDVYAAVTGRLLEAPEKWSGLQRLELFDEVLHVRELFQFARVAPRLERLLLFGVSDLRIGASAYTPPAAEPVLLSSLKSLRVVEQYLAQRKRGYAHLLFAHTPALEELAIGVTNAADFRGLEALKSLRTLSIGVANDACAGLGALTQLERLAVRFALLGSRPDVERVSERYMSEHANGGKVDFAALLGGMKRLQMLTVGGVRPIDAAEISALPCAATPPRSCGASSPMCPRHRSSRDPAEISRRPQRRRGAVVVACSDTSTACTLVSDRHVRK